MNIEVSIDLTSYGLKSNTTAVTFERTKTELDTGNYDGSPTYYFEVNALNTDSSDKTVYLVDSGGSTIASLTVSSGGSSGDLERFRSTSFTPTSGSETYRIKLEDTTSANQLEVSNARILIQQTNFTKTRVSFDMMGRDDASSNADTELSSTNGGYPSIPFTGTQDYPFFRYDSGYFTGTVTYEHEILAYRTGGSATEAALFRVSNGNKVTNSAISVTAASFTVHRATIGADSDWVSGNDYQFASQSTHIFTSIKTAYSKVYVTITSATKVRTYHQLGAGINFGAGIGTGVSREDRRVLYDADLYANATTYWELTARDSFGDASLKPTLDHYGTNDGPGTTGDTEVDDQTISSTMTRYINSESLTDGNRYGHGAKRPIGGAIVVYGAWLVISEEELADAAQTRTEADDLNNWSDAVRHDHVDQSAHPKDDLNNWDDYARHDHESQSTNQTDSLNNWSDSASLQIGYFLTEEDDLDNWLDDENHDLVDATGDLTDTFADDLDNWLDAVALLLWHGLSFSDDLDNWLDSVNVSIPELTEQVGDSLNNWLDAASIDFTELSDAFGDDLNNWLDSINVEVPELGYSFGDDLNNWADDITHDYVFLRELSFGDTLNYWQDFVRHDHPEIHLSFGDTLHNWLDSLHLPKDQSKDDSLNYWQDNISLLMPSNLRYQVFVDWENDGAFGSDIDNITSDVYAMQWSYGRDYASQLSGKSTAGSCKLYLRNTTGKYNSFKTTSPLYGNLVPGRKIVIIMHTSDVSTQMFGGFVEAIESNPSIHGAHSAVLTGLGPISQINEQKINVAMQTNIKTGTAVGQVLSAAGWPASERLLDVGYTTMSRWWTGGKMLALNAIRKLEDTEVGFLRETKDGKIAFEDKWHRLKIANFVSKATFRDVPGASVVYSDIYQEDPLKEIYNIVKTQVRYFELGDEDVVLWKLEDEPTIAAGETAEYWAACPSSTSSPGAIAAEEWITPVHTTDYRAGSAPGAANMTGFMSVAVTKFDTGMKILMTNTHGSNTAYVSHLQARGTALYETSSTNIQDEYTDSQALYGERTWPATDTYFPDIATAEGFIHWVLENYSFPRPIINLEFSTYRNSELVEKARTLDVSDMIDIEANPTTKLGLNRKFFIEKITHLVTDSGLEHRVQFECSAVVGGAFVEQAVGDDLNNWNDGINYQLDDVIYTPVDKTVVIHEMFGQGHSSRPAANGGDYQTNFATLTIDPSKFNGVVKAEWEIVGDNYDSTSKTIELYENGVSIKTLSIGAGQYYYRTSIEFTWPSTSKVYTINIPETTSWEDVVVYRSRIKIYQEEATKTQIQIMFHGSSSYGWNYWGGVCDFQGDDNYPEPSCYVDEFRDGENWVQQSTVTGSEYFRDEHTRWVYDASHWGTINGITLEAAIDVQAIVSSTGHIRLYNEDTSQQVGAALSLANDASPACPVTDEKTVAIDPSLLVDGDTYVLQGKIVGNNSSVATYRACIYLELSEGLDAFETYYDMGREGQQIDWEFFSHYFDFDDFGHVTNVRSWLEAAVGVSGGDGKGYQLSDGTNNYGFIGFPYIDGLTYEIKDQEFNHRNISVGNHYTKSTLASQGRLRCHRIIVYQNVNEAGFVDDLNNWNDGANVVKSP